MKLLISLDYIKDMYPILAYVQEADIMPYVKMAQETYLEKALGKFLLDKLKSNDTLTTKEEELKLYYVKPYLLHSTIYMYGRDCNFKFTNRGISKQTSDNSSSADLEEVIYKTNTQKDILDSYANRLLSFIDDNRVDLGLQSVNCNEGPDINTFNYGGIYIPETRPRVYTSRSNDI